MFLQNLLLTAFLEQLILTVVVESILIMTFPGWLSGTYVSCLCLTH